MATVGVLVAAGGLAAFGRVPAAEAHAGLTDTSPRASSVLDEPPTEIVLDFDEAVESSLSTVTLLDQDGAKQALGPLSNAADHSQIVVPVTSPDDLGAGIYVVVYRVTSSDSHPVSGSFSFQIGTGAGDQQAVLDRIVPTQPTADRAVGWALGGAKFLAFVGLALLLGSWLFALVIHGDERDRRAFGPPAWTGVVALAVGTVATFVLQGPRVVAGGLGDAFDTGLWSDVAGTRYGKALLVRLVLVALAVLPVVGIKLADLPPWRVAAGSVAGCMLLTYGVAGHPGSGRLSGLGVLLDTVHLGAVSFWLGGLFLLALGRRWWLRDDDRSRQLAGRFSTIALVAVPLAVVTGAAQTWRIVRDLGGLSDTTFGRTLIAKVSVVLFLVVLGGLARTALRRFGPSSIRAIVCAEATMGLLVFGITAGLVSVPPEIAHLPAPVVVSVAEGDLTATITITPAAVGANDIHVTVTQPSDAVEPSTSASLRLALPDLGIEPESVSMSPSGADHYSAFGVLFAFAGNWDISLVIETSSGDSVLMQTTVAIPAG